MRILCVLHRQYANEPVALLYGQSHLIEQSFLGTHTQMKAIFRITIHSNEIGIISTILSSGVAK